MKTFLCAMFGVILNIYAQGLQLNEAGTYEKKEVVTVDGVSAAILYDRAMTALTAMTGADGKAKSGIDYQNQETCTVVYKGSFSLGIRETLAGGIRRYGNFTLTVKCKDGRAQVAIDVPTVTAMASNGMKRDHPIKDLVNAVEKTKGKRRERGDAILEDIEKQSKLIIASVAASMMGAKEDDF